ncbi:unnamed protein product [Fraxinus pennsylvanica]|uniref:Helicase ATP-binding domain-containing protein n=1 Tax=Fraxinus pennsylvanica TaxID=56036 RepID=A0AAD1ZUB2_9LAMI|nr:unnamed protein product [Fraxinus pennsylvanica]
MGKSHTHDSWVPESELYGTATMNVCNERLIVVRSTEDGSTEAFVKWTDVPYDRCTWEKVDDLYLKTHRIWLICSITLNAKPCKMMRLNMTHCRGRVTSKKVSFGSFIHNAQLDGRVRIVDSYLNIVEYHGSARARTMICQYEWNSSNPCSVSKKTPAYKFNVLTTYEMVIADSFYLRGVLWEVLVVDEGHHLKNASSVLFGLLNTCSFQHRVLLTGTPLQNNIGELYNLLNFLQPASFCSLSSFGRSLMI